MYLDSPSDPKKMVGHGLKLRGQMGPFSRGHGGQHANRQDHQHEKTTQPLPPKGPKVPQKFSSRKKINSPTELRRLSDVLGPAKHRQPRCFGAPNIPLVPHEHGLLGRAKWGRSTCGCYFLEFMLLKGSPCRRGIFIVWLVF